MLQTMNVSYEKFDPADAGMPAALMAFRPDVAFPALHGPGGEDGCIQGFLESAGIPYVGSGVAASAICMNKLYTKWAFEALAIPTPRWALVESAADLEEKLATPERSLPPFPVVVKPLTEGSSVGVAFVKTAVDLVALAEKRNMPLLVEERIVGRELTLPVFGRPIELLPVIEIRPKAGFFDFDAKYTNGMTDYICPADISAELRETLNGHAMRIAGALGLRHMSRIDVMLAGPQSATEKPPLPGMPRNIPPDGQPYFLEINTIPGMTATSLLPMSAKAAGIEFPELIRKLIDMAKGARADEKS